MWPHEFSGWQYFWADANVNIGEIWLTEKSSLCISLQCFKKIEFLMSWAWLCFYQNQKSGTGWGWVQQALHPKSHLLAAWLRLEERGTEQTPWRLFPDKRDGERVKFSCSWENGSHVISTTSGLRKKCLSSPNIQLNKDKTSATCCFIPKAKSLQTAPCGWPGRWASGEGTILSGLCCRESPGTLPTVLFLYTEVTAEIWDSSPGWKNTFFKHWWDACLTHHDDGWQTCLCSSRVMSYALWRWVWSLPWTAPKGHILKKDDGCNVLEPLTSTSSY